MINDQREIIVCCCLKHGVVNIKCKFEKNAFHASELIKFKVYVDILNGTTEIEKIKVYLVRYYTIQTLNNYHKLRRH